MGINLANASDLDRSLFNYGVRDSRRKCIFISHKKEDEEAAIAIGDYLTKIANVNIYLDIKDCILQEAVSEENDRKIVASIQTGLNLSTHLLCVISDQTRLSWWVPYEIGFADRQNVEIASLMLKKADDIPSFLKINKSLKNTDDFLHYLSDFGEYGSLTRDFKFEEFNYKDSTKTITLEELENSTLGSDLTSLAAPQKVYTHQGIHLLLFNQETGVEGERARLRRVKTVRGTALR